MLKQNMYTVFYRLPWYNQCATHYQCEDKYMRSRVVGGMQGVRDLIDKINVHGGALVRVVDYIGRDVHA